MNDEQLTAFWHKRYLNVPKILSKTTEIKLAATGFNTNVDAITKISGEQISKLAEKFDISLHTVQNCPPIIDSPQAVICGIIKCFTEGIAEEWLTTDEKIDAWTAENIASTHTQMGGQAGIIANVLALTDVQKILVNTASHTKMQADCFLAIDKLLATDEKFKLLPAYKIERKKDLTPIHRIIEFDKGECAVLSDGTTIICPKANRFIASYDPFNTKLTTNSAFSEYLLKNGCDYFIFAGYNLLSGDKGLQYAQKSAIFLQNLKALHPNSIFHLEIASTQDKIIRRYMLEKIAESADSIGLNERETLDCCEVLFPETYKKLKTEPITAANLFKTILKIKEFTQVKRIQLHMFGLYICLQDKDYKFSADQSLNGMLCASVAAASKAELGFLKSPSDLVYSLSSETANIYLNELKKLSDYLSSPELLSSGIGAYENYDLAVIPTMLIEKPKTLVGMGDTISSISLICSR